MFKRFLSFAAAVFVFVSAININIMPVGAQLMQGEVVTSVYYMNFSPDSDGKFYDSPAGADGRQEVARIANPSGITLFSGSVNADDKIIALTGDSTNPTRIHASAASATNYSAFSRGSATGDINTGASGAADDYCIKVADTATSGSGTVKLNFPKTYGGAQDSIKKYRYEMDWKWQGYSSTTATKADGSITGAAILSFYIGGKTVALRTKSSSESTDARGPGAIFFYDGDNSASSTYGLTPSAQKTAAADTANVTKSAEKFSSDQSAKWIHITVDIDFASGTLWAKLEGDGESREISTAITKGSATFAEGITGIGMCGSTGGERRMNYMDNVRLSTVAPPSDEQVLENVTSTPYTFNDIKGGNTDIANVTEDLYLPSVRSGVSVTWAVSPASASRYINLATGAVTRPTFAEGDVTVSLTPTYTLNSASSVGTAISGIVLKASDPADYPLDAEYYMDFSPRGDGEFYDLPAGMSDATQVKRLDIPGDASVFANHTAADGKCIAMDSDDNISKIMPSTRAKTEYVVFSKGSANGDVNTGASGDKDDYCIKVIDASSSTAPSVRITFPKAYGNPECSGDYVKYRFEMDYKWQQYSADLSSTSSSRPTGTTWLRFYFGDNYINLYSKASSDQTAAPDANGASALCFTGTSFGMDAQLNQLVPVGQTGKVTAPMFGGSVSGSWVHITVDFDFEEATIKAVLKADGADDRIIETSIPDGTGTGGASFKSLFMQGLTGVAIRGTSSADPRVISADNIKISPMQTVKPTPSQKLHDANNPATAFDDIKGANSDASDVRENLALIFKKGDADVSWEVSPASASKYVKGNSGLVTRPSFVEGNKSVTLTPTYTVAGRSLVGDPVDIVVTALDESPREKIERLISTAPFTFNDIKGINTASNEVFADLSLPSSAEGVVSVTWTVTPAEMAEFVAASDGTVTRPQYSDTDKNMQLVPTYSMDAIVMQGRPIEITVIRNTLDASDPDVKDAYAITAADLVGSGQSLDYVTGSLNLPRTGKLYGSAISWISSSPVVDASTGNVNRPFGASKLSVVLTATVTYGGESTVRTFDITLADDNYGSGYGYGGSSGSSGGGVAFAGSAVATPTPGTSPAPDNDAVFNDLASVAWAEEYITKLCKAGVINGDGTGAFHPDRNVTREEFVKMLLLTFGIEPDDGAKSDFADVDSGSWYEAYVAKASGLGIVNGISATSFGTGHSITRQDMAVMIVRCLELKGISMESDGNANEFGDEAGISGYAVEAVKLLHNAGILNGDASGNFNPALFAKRAEVAKVLGILMPETK